jgi:hypothetical protein
VTQLTVRRDGGAHDGRESFGDWSRAMNLTMNPTTGLRLSAIFFTVFWTAGMVWLSRTSAPASVILTVIGGCIAGYLWYRTMRWLLTVRRVPSAARSGWFGRNAASAMTNRWTDWAVLMVLSGVATAYLRGYADAFIPAGEWHQWLSGLFVIVVWPSLMWSLQRVFRRYPLGLLSVFWPRYRPRDSK